MDRFLHVLTVKRFILIIIVMPFGVVEFAFFLRFGNDGFEVLEVRAVYNVVARQHRLVHFQANFLGVSWFLPYKNPLKTIITRAEFRKFNQNPIIPATFSGISAKTLDIFKLFGYTI